MPNTDSPARGMWLQSLRALAALYVVLFHLRDPMGAHPLTVAWAPLFQQGFAGVDVFFVISGFVVGRSMLRREPSWSVGAAFVTERALRVFTGYWPVLAIAALLAYLGIQPIEHMRAKALDSIFLLTPSFFAQWYPVAWTLAYEVRFYLLLALLYFVCRPGALGVKVWAVIALMFAYHLYWVITLGISQIHVGYPLINTMGALSIEFLVGVWLATLPPGQLRGLLGWLPLLVLLAALGLLAGSAAPVLTAGYEFLRISTYGVFGVALVLVALALDANGVRHSPWLAKVGDASYSLYLTHPLVLIGLEVAMHTWPQAQLVLIVLTPVVCVALALLWYRWIERPAYDGARALLGHVWPAMRRRSAAPA